jgi:hypothetical protein
MTFTSCAQRSAGARLIEKRSVMQITSQTTRQSGSGFALTITLIFLAVSLMVFGSMMYWVSTSAKISLRNNQFNMSEAAAEAANERVLAQMDRDFLAQSLTNASYYAALLPNQTNWPVQYTFTDTTGNVNQISVNLGPPASNSVPLNSQFSGLYGLAQSCTLTATATPIGQPYNVPATVSESLQFASIPLFQFAIFYNMNLEICPGQTMSITGPVFCNQSIWEGSELTTFLSTVSAVGTNSPTSANPFATNYNPHNGTPPGNFASTPLSNVNPLTMPIGTNNSPTAIQALLNLPPPTYALGTAAAYSTNGQIYLANGADLFITNTASGTNSGSAGWIPSGTNNTIIYYQDAGNTPYLTPIANDFYLLKTGGSTNYVDLRTNPPSFEIACITNVSYAGYSFVTNVAFYDYRESAVVQALQIDIAKFNLWVTNSATNGGNSSFNGSYNQTCQNHKGHPIDSIYVYNSTAFSGTQLPAVRVINGTNLPSSYGFTVATPFPMYVYGNYNLTDSSGTTPSSGANSPSASYHAWPAALMADAITILSGSWNDSYNSGTSLGSRNPSTTVVNAAMLEGIVPTDPTISANYSGGVENFMRLLESWNGTPLYYNGSIVVMFPSQYATNSWITPGTYYQAPSRPWAFDTHFRSQSGLPPLTPQSKAVIRGQWNASP